MKTIVYFFIITLFLFAACEKDEIYKDDPASDLKSAHMKMVPLKADCYSVNTLMGEYNLPKEGYLVGTFSHLGEIIPETSTWTVTNLELTEEFWVGYVEGQLAAANGDLLFYSFTGTLDLVKNEYTAVIYYSGGTGRFQNCTGEAALSGYLDQTTGSFIMKVNGMLSNIGSSK